MMRLCSIGLVVDSCNFSLPLGFRCTLVGVVGKAHWAPAADGIVRCKKFPRMPINCPVLFAAHSSSVSIGAVMMCECQPGVRWEIKPGSRPRRSRASAHRLPANLKCTWVDDVGRATLDEVHHVVKGGPKVHFVAVLFHITNVWCANAVFQSQECMALQNGF